ncbi:sirohydrochlorin chelatase [Dermacoccaceae bacterium W4C1]
MHPQVDLPAVVLCAHGTDDPSGRATVLALAELIQERLPSTPVRLAYVDVQEPDLETVVAELATTIGAPVVVPLLLSTGVHVQDDIAAVVERHPGTVAAQPLGPDLALADALARRLTEAGVKLHEPVILGAAGSSRPEAAVAVREVAQLLARQRVGKVLPAYGSAAAPTVPQAVAQLRAAGAERVVVASYLLGEGFFRRRFAESGADLVTAALGAQPGLADLAVRRARAALSA